MFEDDKSLYIFTEFACGGELFDVSCNEEFELGHHSCVSPENH